MSGIEFGFEMPFVKHEILVNFNNDGTHNYLTNMLISQDFKPTYKDFESFLSFFPESVIIKNEDGKLPEEFIQGNQALINLFESTKKSLNKKQIKNPQEIVRKRAKSILNQLTLNDLYKELRNNIVRSGINILQETGQHDLIKKLKLLDEPQKVQHKIITDLVNQNVLDINSLVTISDEASRQIEHLEHLKKSILEKQAQQEKIDKEKQAQQEKLDKEKQA